MTADVIITQIHDPGLIQAFLITAGAAATLYFYSIKERVVARFGRIFGRHRHAIQ